ncbi:MAG: site-specific DNA-methyltransferase [Leptospiraceae bacterium]|nr:site-specific DNA-methyltransferase [Leptospiraceae bacterium]
MATLQFKGKSFVQNHHLAVEHHELIPVKSKSVLEKGGNCSLHDNLIIHGDNLKALKALLPTYAGKVKCIYIDPPYNTGNENWVYNDNVNSPMLKEWLGKVVDKEDLTRHEKWLCMMMPRLKLLRELLAEDGVIFVSIDDNEQHRLRMLMDEVFGEEKFVCQFLWQRRTSSSLDEKNISTDHEYVITYGKGDPVFLGKEKDYKNYSNPDNDPRGAWMHDNPTVGMTKEQRPNQFYDLVDPETGNIFPANPNRVWAWAPETMAKLISEKRIVFPKDSKKKPMFKRYKNDLKSNINPISSILISDVGLNSESTKLLQQIIPDKDFQYSKPLSLLKYILKHSVPNDSIILDSFAGSGTTAHAVLQLNKEDGGNRKFILIECEDYADTITAERVRRVIKKLTTESTKTTESKKKKKGSASESSSVHSVTSVVQPTFSYFELGKPITMENILQGKNMPTYAELARYVFYTATGEEFDERKIDEKKHYIGQTKKWDVYLFYKPDIEYLKQTALNLEDLEKLGKNYKKRRLIFAPTKYVEQDWLDEYGVDFSQLPFEIYRFAETK